MTVDEGYCDTCGNSNPECSCRQAHPRLAVFAALLKEPISEDYANELLSTNEALGLEAIELRRQLDTAIDVYADAATEVMDHRRSRPWLLEACERLLRLADETSGRRNRALRDAVRQLLEHERGRKGKR
jgi:hypothetical protein